eukprot:11180743-Lingulodinium_polyedra.AAC.1
MGCNSPSGEDRKVAKPKAVVGHYGSRNEGMSRGTRLAFKGNASMIDADSLSQDQCHAPVILPWAR